MKSRNMFALLPVILLSALVLTGCGRSGDLSLPKKAEKTVSLKPGGSEKIRFNNTNPDGSTTVRIEYTDERSATVLYRADHTLASADVWYPAPKNSTVRQLQKHAVYGLDGKTYVSNVEYYSDGKLARQGTNFGGSTIFESYSFAPDGQSVTRHQRFLKKDGKWVAAFDESYAGNGKVISSLEPQSDGGTIVTTWNEGVKTSVTKTDAIGSTITTDSFYPDGVTVYKTVEQGSYQTTVTLKRFDGTMIVKRVIGASSLEVSYFTEKGEPSFNQTFTLDKKPTSDGGTISVYRLTAVAETDTKGTVLRSIVFGPDGVTPSSVTINKQPSGSGHTNESLAADGTISKVEVYDGSNNLVSTSVHTSSDNLRDTIPSRLTDLEKFDRPPAPTGKSAYTGYEGYDF